MNNTKRKEKGPALGQAQLCGGVKLVNRIPITPFYNWIYDHLMNIKLCYLNNYKYAIVLYYRDNRYP